MSLLSMTMGNMCGIRDCNIVSIGNSDDCAPGVIAVFYDMDAINIG